MDKNISLLLKNLNNKQKLAVSTKNKKTLVIAGAGSGKTKLLIHKIAWLTNIENHSYFSILAVTFTNKAAKEMNDRAKKLIFSIDDNYQNMWIGTFHSIAYRILRKHYIEANLPINFQIIDNNDQLRLLKNIIKSIKLDNKIYSPEKSISYINKKKNEGLKPINIKNINKKDDLWLKIYFLYEEICERSGLIDFSELLIRVYELFLQNTKILSYYRNKFTNILVDEFQDTNYIQYSWLKLLISKNTNIILVGDDDQSIYTWRGAKIENIRYFLNDFPDTKIIYLEQNYRSTNNILNAANHLIANNKNRFNKKLWTNCHNGEEITIYNSYNELDESNFIIKKIISFKEEGGFFNDCAILYRNNFQSRIVEDNLLKYNIPYCIYGGTKFFDRKEIKDALAYLRLIINHKDDIAFDRIINLPPRGIGNKTIQLIRKISKENKITLWCAVNVIIKKNLLSKKIITSLKNFLKLILSLKKEIKEISLKKQTNTVIIKSGLLDFYKKEIGEKGIIRIDNLKELVSAASQHINDQNNMTPLQSFITKVSFDVDNINKDEYQNSVKLMTIHTSKGLEFKQVFIIGMEEGIFPSYMSIYESSKLEEERRLAYVGMTRAIKKLTMTYSKNRVVYGKIKNLSKSRFIDELPIQCIEKINFLKKINFF